MAEMNVLSLVEQRVSSRVTETRWLVLHREVKRTRIHLDFVIDGIPLREHVRRWSGLDEAPADVSLLTGFDPELAIEQIDRLLGLIPHQYGDRAWLLFCPECFQERCGGLTTGLSIDGDRVTWSGFGWGTDVETEAAPPVMMESAPTFTFDRARYERVLRDARVRFSVSRGTA